MPRNAVLTITIMVSFAAPFMASSVNIALPAIGREFSMDAILLGWVATSYILASAVLLIPMGRLADIHGRKRYFSVGITIFTISSVLLAISTSTMMIISFRLLQGIGVAMISTTSLAMLISVFPVGQRGRALGFTIAAVYLGLSLGPTLGGFLTENFGWRSIFWFNAILGSVIILTTFFKLKGVEWAESKGESFDIVGALMLGFALICIIYGLSLLPAVSGGILFILGFLSMVLFIRWELRIKESLLNMDLFRRNRVFAFSNLAALINYSATFAITFLMSLYLQYIKDMDAQVAGLVLISMPILQATFSPIAGRLSDRIQPRYIASTGMFFTTIGLIFLIFLNSNSPIYYIIVSLVVVGFGLALFSSPNTNAIMSSVEKRYYGVASALVATMRQVGMLLSMGFALLIFALYIGRVEITPEYYSAFIESLRIIFIIFSVLCTGGIFASMARGNTETRL
ncbi:MAG: MFS transporter [Dehalococcoidia bacterium]|nr:MAG: MFS transporter [Dehalococcoidia bacterium]